MNENNSTNEEIVEDNLNLDENDSLDTSKKKKKNSKDKTANEIEENLNDLNSSKIRKSNVVDGINYKEEKPIILDLNKTKILETIVVDEKSERAKLNLEKKNAKKSLKIEKKIKKDRQKAIHKKGPRTIERYDTDIENGLSEELVTTRTDEGLVNFSNNGSTKSYSAIIVSNVFTFFNMIMVIIAGLLISVKAWTDLIFLVIVTANVIIGIYQEIRAKKTIDRLSLISAPTANVIRDGKIIETPVSEVVLDDLLLLESGKQICSDCIVVSGSIEVNESLLTGESDAIIKVKGDVLYSGSFVVSGTCKARVDKIGKDNYINQLANQARKYKKPKSDLLKSLNMIIWVMAFVVVAAGLGLFYMQYMVNGVDYVTTIRKTAGAVIGMIPSGLYLLTSVALAVGVIKLAQNNVLVQELYCIEMLARVNVLCLDKTGTITDGTMYVKNVIEYNTIAGLSTKNVISAMLNALNEKNLTSVALEEKFGRGKRMKHIKIIPFSSQRKYSAVTFERYGTFILGAPEFVLGSSYSKIEKEVNNHAIQGFRVLCLGHVDGSVGQNGLPDEEVNVVSLILIEDNVRPDAVDTINYFKESGVEVKVISGDNPLTVSKISERAGIRNADQYISLEGMPENEVIRIASKYTVFGRVSPIQKKILVKALKDEKNIVAMTGDGVNDILALKEADCSIAVASGSEAARNVSHLVLLDSNFGSMPRVVSEGRRVINNVSKVACLFLTKTIFSFLLAMQALNSGGAYPISTNQLVIIDFLVIGFPAFVLVLEPNNSQVEGNFLVNIIKGALPGALTILLNSVIVFSLMGNLHLNFRSSSTLIVIIATHTCMMVLFKVCKPYNLMRKFLCGGVYALFIILVLFLPSFFEFSPVTALNNYYSPSLEVETLRDVPSIAISKDGYYVIDGTVTTYVAQIDTQTFTLSANDNGLLILNGIQTDYAIKIPSVSEDESGYFIVEGIDTNISYSEYVSFKVTTNGYLVITIKDTLDGITVSNYNIFPTVQIGTDGKYVINGKPTSVQAKKASISNNEVRLSENYEILVNGEKIGILDKPLISCNSNGNLVIGGTRTNINNTMTLSNTPTITISGSYYMFDGEKSDFKIISPKIQITQEGFYIINGKYTVFESKGDRNTYNYTVSDEGYLEINGVTTDVLANVEISYGGTVNALPMSALLLMLTLCLAAAPLMNILTGIVPWVKRQYQNVQVVISKL